MSMKLWKNCVLGVSLLGVGIAPCMGAGADQATSNVAVLKLGANVVTQDALTSYAAQMAQLTGGFPLEGKALVEDYILTNLYEKIPTTATITADSVNSTATPYDTTPQRNLLKRTVQEQVLKNTEVPRAELEAWYAKNKKQYQKPERVFALHLFMETSEDNPTSSPAKVRQRLEGIKAKIDSGTSFSVAAKEFSEAASSKNGGQIGYITPRQPIGPLNKPMNPELETVFFQLKPNTVSDVVDTRHGMHLLYITDKRTTETPTVDDLLTSGILPGTLARDQATSKIREMVQETIAKYNGKVLPGFSDNDTITTDTVAFEINGRKMTVGDLSEIFGDRFTNYVDSIKSNKPEFRKLMEQGMEDEGLVLTAIDLGVAKQPEMAKELALMGRKADAEAHINAILDAETTVTEKQVEARYRQLLDRLRKPEVEGYLIEVDVKKATETAEQARERDAALKLAQKVTEAMQTTDLATLAKQIKSQPNDNQTTAIAVPRHVEGEGKTAIEHEFDRVVPSVQGDKGVSQVVPIGEKMVAVKVENRYPGKPVPLSEVHDRLEQMLQAEARGEVRNQLLDRLEKAGLVEYLPGAASFGVIAGNGGATAASDSQTSASTPQ